MPPKRRPKTRGAASEDLFHYSNQVELTFKNQPKPKLLSVTVDSSSSDEDTKTSFRKSKNKSISYDNDSPSSSDLEELSGSTPTKIKRNDSIDEVEVTEQQTVVDRPVTPPPPDEVISSFPSKKGLKISRDLGNKLKLLQAVTEQDWSDVMSVDKHPSFSDRKITLKIRTTSGVVERVPVLMSDTFENIISKLAEENNVPVETVSLSFTDTQGSFQTLKATDSPLSVNLSCADIIECHIVHPVAAFLGVLDEDDDDDENVIDIKIQGTEPNSTKLFKVLKNEPLGNIMQQYADFRKINTSKIRFCFDGEDIQPTETPESLDMDEENMVEVVIS